MGDVDATNFLNLGMSFKVDYRSINFFNLKTEIENEKKRVELVNQKLQEEKERQELLKKKREEEQQIKQEVKQPQPQPQPIVKVVEVARQEQPIIKQQEPIIKDYYFENETAIKEVNELLASLTRFKIVEINGVKKRVIIGVIK
jgi:ATP-dependent 26S proteasome regulatory subunit